ncbi:hypothetical protein EZV73_07560 [Acidaminobacter sp. JC074]|uniref:hypothetical protein n=1 Tax=Acidaminobacter sp. JC074 TaxID=2530199 RepID=UPI001F117847|nr:hypothetical protein [Acidaminobacter sp. JC074]MCH4887422.1 hypothetical protein [Acidaminobacter sp. JC074]
MLSKKDKDILKTSEKLEELSSDEEIRLIAESRAKYLSDYNSNIAGAEAKGVRKTEIRAIKGMLEINLSLEEIARVLNLSLDKIKELIKDNDL